MTYKITNLTARQILDSRGNPTIETQISLNTGVCAYASSPSGASVGSKEALELRDNDLNKYFGKGVLKAIEKLNSLKSSLFSQSFETQLELDEFLIKLDGTENKSNIGANAILSLSMAFAKAIANSNNIPLYKSLSASKNFSLPTPLVNIINGGAHADNPLDIQEFMIVPFGIASFEDKIRAACEIFSKLKSILKSKSMVTAVGDEGGFAPNISKSKEALDLILEAIDMAGYTPGTQIAIALDMAASEFYKNGKYTLKGEDLILDSDGMISYISNLASEYPIISIEDPMSEYDTYGWQQITKELGSFLQIVGDDVFVTNPSLISDGISNGLANAVLIKPNQIGTVSQSIEAINIAKKAGYKTIISHRSGETEDTFISHLAVGLNAGQIKTGSMSRGERIAKYNELLRISESL